MITRVYFRLCIDHASAVMTDTGGFCRLAARMVGRTAVQHSVKMFLKTRTDEIQRNRVDARVNERQTKADDSEGMPELVVVFIGVGIEVEPQKKDVHGKEADREENDE